MMDALFWWDIGRAIGIPLGFVLLLWLFARWIGDQVYRAIRADINAQLLDQYQRGIRKDK